MYVMYVVNKIFYWCDDKCHTQKKSVWFFLLGKQAKPQPKKQINLPYEWVFFFNSSQWCHERSDQQVDRSASKAKVKWEEKCCGKKTEEKPKVPHIDQDILFDNFFCDDDLLTSSCDRGKIHRYEAYFFFIFRHWYVLSNDLDICIKCSKVPTYVLLFPTISALS